MNGSYEAIGNNGNCYNDAVNDPACSGIYSQNLRNALLEFSDHLPVVMEIETPQNTLSTTSYSQSVQVLKSNLVETTLELTLQPNSPIKTLNIYNTNGQLIQSVNVKNLDQTTFNINVEHLSNGIYYISAQNLSSPLKFVKI